MPHSLGCPGHSHKRAGDAPCELYRRERALRQFRWAEARTGDCTSCTATGVPVIHHGGEPYCRTCYGRWWHRGFAGPGPGPGGSATDRAEEYAPTIQALSASEAARVLNVSTRTVVRWRALLRTMHGREE